MGTSVFVVVSLRHDTGYKLREGIARGKKGISATIQPCIRTPCIRARSRRPSAARPRFAGPPCCALGRPARYRFAGPRAALRAPPVPVVPERVIVLVLPVHINRRYSTGTIKGVS
jgi:hypothetical protein